MAAALDTHVDDVAALVNVRAEELGARVAFRWFVTGDVDGGVIEWSYAELDRRARLVAERLSEVAKPGDRVLLLFAPGLDFVSAFFGCIYAGLVAVPTYPPDPSRLPQTLPRMRAIVNDAGARVLCTTTDVLAMAGALAEIAPDLATLRWMSVDDLDETTRPSLGPVKPSPDDVAFLQYTSGSTGEPKGVMVTHANIIANERMMQAATGIRSQDRGMGWVPLFHDLGLIANVLQTMWVGMTSSLMSPLAFLKEPMRWLRIMSHEKATISGGPDFAYELCARKVTSEDMEKLDLRAWRCAFTSAEPIRASTIERFRRTFARVGFDPRAFLSAFGLAESTLAVTASRHGSHVPMRDFDKLELGRGKAVPAEGPRAATLVSSGRPLSPAKVAIVDPETLVRWHDGHVGEIWMRSPSIARGYWGKPELSGETFGAMIRDDGPERWLRTGDLGFVLDGELYVTGRRKDLIIVRGSNHYPQDIERTAESNAPVLRPGCSAAFSIEREDGEAVVLVAEADGSPDALRETLAAVRQAVLDAHEISLDDVVLLRPRTVRKTSSGKIQRHANKAAYLAGEHEVLLSLRGTRPISSRRAPAPRSAREAPKASDDARAVDVAFTEKLLMKLLGGLAHVPLEALSPEASLGSIGLDSLKLAGLVGDLERELGFEIPLEVFHGQTIAGAARLLADRRAKRGAVAVLDLRAEATLPEGLAPARPFTPGRGPMFITGATGFVGTALLVELLARAPGDVICLVRAENDEKAMARVREALQRVGKADDDLLIRITAIAGDLAAPRLGLSEEKFSSLADRVSAIYHCGGVVHWTSPYAALRKANVGSALEILALAAPHNVPIHYVSSLGVYPFGATNQSFFAEDADIPGEEHLRLGYFQSKWVADTLFASARRRGFVVSIYRPGLVSGDSRTGMDAPSGAPLLPSYLAGCARMGSAPAVDKVLDVVPVDYVAAAIAALSLRPEGLGRSYNLKNPHPMRQLDAHAALREMGHSIREIPYALWRNAVLALADVDPENPLARFGLYYRFVTEERMRTMERQTATGLPVEDRNTRALLPPDVRCPPFDRALLSTYLRHAETIGLMPARRAAEPAAPRASLYHFVERYDHENDRISKLYDRGKDKQWNAASKLDWSHELDPENPEMLPDTALPIYGSALFSRMSPAEKARVRRHFQSWQVSQTLHGEQGALLCASKIVQQAPSLEARLYAATQVADEARHVELFSRLLHDKIGLSHPMTPPLRRLLDDVLSDARWDMTFLGMQVLVEGLALAAFSLNRDQSRDPLVSAAYAYVIEDEARHVAFGRLALKDYYPLLSEKERDEREEFVVEGAFLLRDRLQGDDIWKDLGLPSAEVLAHVRTSSFQRSYRRELFSRIVPLVRAIGLWGPRVQAAFADMGVLGFAQIDLDALAAEDERRALTMQQAKTS